MPKGALSPGVEGGRGSRSNYPQDPSGYPLRGGMRFAFASYSSGTRSPVTLTV
jgi:hypothetical protein